MKYRTLGRTGLKVAEVGIGTWQLADDPECWVGADLDESYRSLIRYVELGGNFIDTAWMYGWDDSKPERHPSQELIGKFLQDTHVRDKVYIASKVAPMNFKWPAQSGIPIGDVFPNEWIRKSVDDCLHSLRVEYIDLMQFHVWHDEFADRDEWKEEIQRLTREGKVKYWGISINNYEPENILKTLETGLIDAVQFIFNIFHQRPTEKLLPYAKQHNIGLIARVPLDEGGLTGKFTTDTVFPEGDLRRRYFSPKRLLELVTRTDALKSLLGNEAQSLTELALRWILSFDEVSTVIPGMRRVRYVEENTKVSYGRRLTDQIMKQLQDHAWERDFYLAD